MENEGFVSTNSYMSKRSQVPTLGLGSSKAGRGRILPSSTADVQAAIAAIQARSVAMKQKTNLVAKDYMNPGRTPDEKRQNADDDSTIDSNEENSKHFASIGNIIDQMNTNEKINKSIDDDSLSDSDLSDFSMGMDVAVPQTTKVSISAFIDSLNQGPKPGDEAPKVAIEDKDTPMEVSKDGQGDPDEVEEIRNVESETLPEYDLMKFDEFTDKATKLGMLMQRDRKNHKKLLQLETLLFNTWKEKIPIVPILDVFEDAMGGDDDCAAMSLTYYIREAVKLVESKAISMAKKSEILEDAEDDDVETAFIQAIFNNPEKHVPYEGGIAAVEAARIEMENLRILEQKELEEKLNVDTSQFFYYKYNVARRSEFSKSAKSTSRSSDAPVINATSVMKKYLKFRIPSRHPSAIGKKITAYKLPAKERTKKHSGYKAVSASSLVQRCKVQQKNENIIDVLNWESLGLELLGKRSLDTATNWFGKFNLTFSLQNIVSSISNLHHVLILF